MAVNYMINNQVNSIEITKAKVELENLISTYPDLKNLVKTTSSRTGRKSEIKDGYVKKSDLSNIISNNLYSDNTKGKVQWYKIEKEMDENGMVKKITISVE